MYHDISEMIIHLFKMDTTWKLLTKIETDQSTGMVLTEDSTPVCSDHFKDGNLKEIHINSLFEGILYSTTIYR